MKQTDGDPRLRVMGFDYAGSERRIVNSDHPLPAVKNNGSFELRRSTSLAVFALKKCRTVEEENDSLYTHLRTQLQTTLPLTFPPVDFHSRIINFY